MFGMRVSYFVLGSIGVGTAALAIWLWSLSYRERRAMQHEKQRREEIATAIRARDLQWGWAVQRTFFPTKQDVLDARDATIWTNYHPASMSPATKDICLVHLYSGTVIAVTGHKTPLDKKVGKI